jgi:hypothetical protein
MPSKVTDQPPRPLTGYGRYIAGINKLVAVLFASLCSHTEDLWPDQDNAWCLKY